MKLLALTCGRKMANCEILTKEALMGAEELGAEVEIIRMLDLEIHHCNICWPCPAMMKGYSACIYKDDGPFLFEKIMESDAILISSPIYSLTPPGYLIAIRDRILGNKVDTASLGEVKKTQGKDERFQWTFHIDDRIFKNRIGGFISVGGAISHDWVTLGLPMLYTMVFPMNVKIVDQMQVCGVADDGAITLKENELKKARNLGKNIAKAFLQPYESVKFVGEDKGVCPVCHCNNIVIDGDSGIICASCGVRGTLKIEGNRAVPVFPPEEQEKSHLFLEGKRIHHFEVGNVIKELDPYKDKIPELSKKYAAYKSPVVPPSKQKKNQ